MFDFFSRKIDKKKHQECQQLPGYHGSYWHDLCLSNRFIIIFYSIYSPIIFIFTHPTKGEEEEVEEGIGKRGNIDLQMTL